nr:hypothetical protein CFP56_17803 [Quercus suber]
MSNATIRCSFHKLDKVRCDAYLGWLFLRRLQELWNSLRPIPLPMHHFLRLKPLQTATWSYNRWYHGCHK